MLGKAAAGVELSARKPARCWYGSIAPDHEELVVPEKLTNILYEYYGKLRHPQTPESALIHMVDALIVRLDHIKNDVADSEWNHEILIIQTLNELSSSGMYDESGLSMNHFLKIRDYLTKEELLK